MEIFKHGNMFALVDSKDTVNFLQKRGEFAKQYCVKKGWSAEFTKLSIEQILEIRNQPEWKNPK